jgi:Mg-chelatase subunit ChlD
MKPFIFFMLMFCMPLLLCGQNKQAYDLDIQAFKKTPATQGPIAPGFMTVQSEYLQISLIRDGYFTIGTNQGTDISSLDNDCQITYGHPYAITSYPVFSVDDTWNRFDTYFTEPESLYLTGESGTLMLFGTSSTGLKIEYFMVAGSLSPIVEITLRMTNSDSVDHTVNGGLIFDPALGKHGDGVMSFGTHKVSGDTVILAPSSVDTVKIREKSTGAKGLGIKLTCPDDQPEKIIAGNWFQMYDRYSPEHVTPVQRQISDLLLRMYWSPKTLAPGEEYTIRTDVQLLPPDFSAPVFCRWDLPFFLTMDKNLMFPDRMKTLLSLSNTSGSALQNVSVGFSLSSPLSTGSDAIAVSMGKDETIIQPVTVLSDLIYEDLVVDANVEIKYNDSVIETLKRPVFIPATPVSDTGLVIVNDSVATTGFPDVDLIFSCEIASTGQRILNLTGNNLFLYENDNRITDFTLEKYQGEGLSQVDFVFVLDVTGSMGNEIDKVKSNLIEFTDSLKTRGVDFRLGMVTFLDNIENVYDFTSDVPLFQDYIDQQYAHGGGDGPENSLDALWRASEMNFRPSARRIFIWITDADFHENDWATQRSAEQVVNELLKESVIVHCVGSSYYQMSAYDRIIVPLGGNFYDINGNFRDILLDIANLKVQDRYALKYLSSLQSGQTMSLKLAIHYAGLGVIKFYSVNLKTAITADRILNCYPNPFNPTIRIEVRKPGESTGILRIYDILGRLVNEYRLGKGNFDRTLWSGLSRNNEIVGSGFYIVQVVLEEPGGKRLHESAKILYLK